MELFSSYDQLATHVYTLALALLRVAVTFLLLPLFSSQLIPPLLRNAIFLAMALIVVVFQSTIDLSALSLVDWFGIVIKEVFVGACIGVFFGIYLWAFEAAGQIVDAQVGMNMAQLADPVTGEQSSLIGIFLSRLANYVFVAAGGLLLLVGSILESYAIWPMTSLLPDFSRQSLVLFEDAFSDFFLLMITIISPMLIVTFLIDVTMGLINRDASQFNVFFLGMPLKMLAVIFILILSVTMISDLLVRQLLEHYEQLPYLLKKLIGMG